MYVICQLRIFDQSDHPFYKVDQQENCGHFLSLTVAVYDLSSARFTEDKRFTRALNERVPSCGQIALAAGVMHTLLWLWYQYRARERAYARRGAVIVILLNAAILLEVSCLTVFLVSPRSINTGRRWTTCSGPRSYRTRERLSPKRGKEKVG